MRVKLRGFFVSLSFTLLLGILTLALFSINRPIWGQAWIARLTPQGGTEWLQFLGTSKGELRFWGIRYVYSASQAQEMLYLTDNPWYGVALSDPDSMANEFEAVLGPPQWGFRFYRGSAWWGASVPLWVIALALAILPTLALIVLVRRFRRDAHGICRNCGYDLRASPIVAPNADH